MSQTELANKAFKISVPISLTAAVCNTVRMCVVVFLLFFFPLLNLNNAFRVQARDREREKENHAYLMVGSITFSLSKFDSCRMARGVGGKETTWKWLL